MTAVSGQLNMRECCVHDCTYGIEVNRDGHASVHNTDVCFTECALVCEGHVALTHCRVWANVATWQGRTLPWVSSACLCVAASRFAGVRSEHAVVCAGACTHVCAHIVHHCLMSPMPAYCRAAGHGG